jgi:hypothetical protein
LFCNNCNTNVRFLLFPTIGYLNKVHSKQASRRTVRHPTSPKEPTMDQTAEVLNRLHDQAHHEAPALRAQAIAAFWQTAGTALMAAARHALVPVHDWRKRLGATMSNHGQSGSSIACLKGE